MTQGSTRKRTIGKRTDGSSRGIPAYLEERGVMLREVHSGYYGPLAYTVASTMMPRPPSNRSPHAARAFSVFPLSFPLVCPLFFEAQYTWEVVVHPAIFLNLARAINIGGGGGTHQAGPSGSSPSFSPRPSSSPCLYCGLGSWPLLLDSPILPTARGGR